MPKGVYLRKDMTGQNNFNWRGGMIKRFCLICNKEILVKSSVVKKGAGKYCSQECKDLGYSKYFSNNNSSRWKGGKIKRICKICNNEFYVEPCQIDKKTHKGYYCSMKCAGKNHSLIMKNHRYYNHVFLKIEPRKIICVQCSKEFCAKKGDHDRKFCSRKCYGRWCSENIQGEKHPTWRGGLSFQRYPKEFHRAKYAIRFLFNKTCQICGKITSIVHHIDYNKQNNTLWNLICLCNSCHSRTNWNRQNWQKHLEKLQKEKGMLWMPGDLRTKLNFHPIMESLNGNSIQV